MKGKSRERFQQIVKVFASYGFGYLLDKKLTNNGKSPENFRKAIEELGPTFIKIGQILSTRDDVLPEEYINELSKLQDSAPFEDISVIKREFENSLNIKINDCFKEFSNEPLASASIAQVHRAVLLNGKEVVVKIQRPDIYDKIMLDIYILKRIIKLTKITVTIVDPLEVLNELEESTKKELNFLLEAENIKKFKSLNKQVVPLYVPEVYMDYCTENIIVMERINGFKINDNKKIDEEGYDKRDIINKLTASFFKQVFDDGFFHGDPHPGNILIYEGKICFIDFGIIGELDSELKRLLNSAIFSVATNDKEKLVNIILAIGIKRGIVDRGTMYEDVSYLLDNYLNSNMKNVKMSVLISELFNITKHNNVQLPKELTILFKSFVILEGVIADLDPNIEVLDLISNYLNMKDKMTLLKEFINKEEVVMSTLKFTRDTVRLPTKTLEVLNKVSSGNVMFKFKILNLEEVLNRFETMINRLIVGIVTAALLVASSMIVSNKIGPEYRGVSVIGITGYFLSALFSFALIINIFKNSRKKNK